MFCYKDQTLTELHYHGINLKLREIYLHSYYVESDGGEETGVEYKQASTFIKNFHVLDQPSYKPILIHLHSTGGCWNNGMAMFNTVQFGKSYTTMLAYAQAWSMSGILLQCPDLRIMMPDCTFMMHHGWTNGYVHHPYGNKQEADLQIKFCQRMLQIFAERAIVGPYFKKRKSSTIQSAYRFFDKKVKEKVDWYLTADEAVYYGLADAILGSKEYPDLNSLRG
jgi:ATP-dependent protease ClpP protease subunit